MAHAFAGPRSMRALCTYNFAGDLGKMTIPAAAALLLVLMPWRGVLVLLGSLGFIAALAIFLLTPSSTPHEVSQSAGARIAHGSGDTRLRLAFPVLLSIGVLDSATRMGFLLFLPFVMTEKGASLPVIGLALTLVFTGGAAGKISCAFLGTRIGAIPTVWLTEGATTLLIIGLLALPLTAALALLPVIGIALNGTSSVLYGSVPDLVSADKRARAFGVFYTGTIGAGALAPALYGALGDAIGVPRAVVVLALLVLLTLPLSLLLRPALRNCS
jgi:predicted MFS family arabinose efflux permease